MARRRRRARWTTLLASAVSVVCGAAATAPAGAAVRDCDVRVEVDTRKLPHAGVTSVRNMGCGAARRVIRHHGKRRSRAPFGDAGARFSLGRWSCTVSLHDHELWRARCARGSRAFRVDYGF